MPWFRRLTKQETEKDSSLEEVQGPILTCREAILEHGLPRVDHHLHSSFSDGHGTPEDFVEAAIRKGLDEIALTEHVWATSEWVPRFVEAIRGLRQERNFRILAGVEAKAVNLRGDVDLNGQYREGLDLVMGVVHRYPTDADYEFQSPSELDAQEAALRETRAIVAMIEQGTVDVVGHPTRTYYRYYGNEGPFPMACLEEIVEAAEKHKVALELTGGWCPDNHLLLLGLRENVLISLGSDSHTPEGVGATYPERFLAALQKS